MRNIWFAGVIIQIPLIAVALEEAASYLPLYHRTLLFWWIAATFACAWIRIYPYTGMAVLILNSAAFLCWLIMAIRNPV